MNESEVWKDVVGYEGRYQVSNKGNVRSVERKDSIGRKCGGRVLKPINNGRGYLRVTLHKNGKYKTRFIHRLVADAFVPNPDNLPQVNHIDEVKTNNELSNLEWCDTKHNINYGTRNTRVSQKLSKKVRAVNVETGDVVEFNSTAEARLKGFSSGGVSASCRGAYKTKDGKLIGDGRTYKGFRWYYDVEEENVSKRVSKTTGF